MAEWHIAQYNVARLRAPVDDPAVAHFVANLAPINELGDATPGFVWRLQTESGNSTSVRIREDPLVVPNLTVWETIEALFDYTYHSAHVEMFRRRKEWFTHAEDPYLVLWWVPAGHIPSVDEADERLAHLAAHGPTPAAFTFKVRFAAPP